ncbi:MAG: hypothetical protein LAO55_04335 [Acidobacteriia bacterium]|nr:hypothetical protein [Terriglobia bacterium]
MEMHVPQPGDQKLARGIDDTGAGRGLDGLRDCGNAPIGYDYGNLLARRGASCVYYGRVLEYDALRQTGGNQGRESEQQRTQTISTFLVQLFCSTSG